MERDAGAISRHVAGMAELPRLTPPGQVFACKNAAVVLNGRVLETMAGSQG